MYHIEVIVAQNVVAAQHDYRFENTCAVCGDYADKGVVFILSGNEYSVTDYTGYASEVIIPSIYKGYPVTSIGDDAFSSCSGLTSITIPAGVTNIGSGAFNGCTNLTDFRVHNGNQSYVVSGDILYNRDMTTLISYFGSKTYVYIPYGVTSIATGVFYGCTGLTFIDMPDSVISIGDSAFSNCSNLTSIVIPNSVISIGEWAFYNCSNLTSIVIPDSMTSIDDYTFYYCSSLTSVIIPDSVTSIGNYAFSSCDWLTDIYFTGTESEWAAITKGTDWDAYTGNYTIHYNYVP